MLKRGNSAMVGTANKMPKLKQSRNSNIHTWFAESAKKQEEKRKAQTKYPWKSTPLPNTFQSSPEIAKELNKREQWKEAVSISSEGRHWGTQRMPPPPIV